MEWVCSCGSVADERLSYCPTCNAINHYRPKVRVPNTALKRTEVVAGSTLRGRGQKNVKMGGVWDEVLPAGIEAPAMLLLFGMPGSGKSSLGMKLAHDFPGRALVMPLETGMGGSLPGTMARLEVEDFDVCCPGYWDELVEVSESYELVLIDSLQHGRLNPSAVRASFVDRGINVIVISQVNAQGDVRGGLAAGHEADVAIALPEYGCFEVRKDRFGVSPREGRWAL